MSSTVSSKELSSQWIQIQKHKQEHPELYRLKSTGLAALDKILGGGLEPGQFVLVGGAQKSGKTTLAGILRGEIRKFQGRLEYGVDPQLIAYSSHSAEDNFFHYSDFYYQQRYNTFDPADVPTVEKYLRYNESDIYMRELYGAILHERLLDTKIIELSSGETRKVLLLKSLFQQAQIYILDNPLSGLDSTSAAEVLETLQMVTRRHARTVIVLLTANPPDTIFDRVIRLCAPELPLQGTKEMQAAGHPTPATDFRVVMQIENETLQAGKRVLIRDLGWKIVKGEKWLLAGANGSGKTTLLSLLNADNPIAYRYKFILFDRPRGSGESIWDIKARIGFISSEIQLYFQGSRTVRDIIMSGFSDTMVLNRRLDGNEREQYRKLVAQLGLGRIEEAPLGRLSSGEKKTVMIARAVVKNPPVLILDEPFQDLDNNAFKFLHAFLAGYLDEHRTLIQTTHHKREMLPGINHIARIEDETLRISC